MSKHTPGNAIRLALLRILDPEAADILETESKRRTSDDADTTAPSAEYLAHRAHVDAVQESLMSFGAPVPQKRTPAAMPSPVPPPRTSLTEEELREQMRARFRPSDFFPDRREEGQP